MNHRQSFRTRPDDFIRRENILDKIQKAFVERDDGFVDKKQKHKDRLASLTDRMDGLLKKGKKGHPMPWSEQIKLEADWLLNYTDDWPRVDRRLDDLEASLTQKQPDHLTQGADGSWGPAIKAHYRKL